MQIMTSDNSAETCRLLRCVADGDHESWGLLLTRHEERLRRMVAYRMDRRLQGRIDPQDIIQDAYLAASAHREEFLRQPARPFFLWLRGIVGNKLLELHRHHLGTQMRDAGREVSLHRGHLPGASSAALADQLLGHATGPSEAAIRAEMKTRLEEALNSMDPLDREVLVLRHFEQLEPAETAEVLGIKEKAAGMRYLRALKRLRDILDWAAVRTEGVAMTQDTSGGPDVLDQLAHEFARRYRRGERPGLTEYTARHPELAAQIRDLFPALAMIEQFGSIAGPPTGPHSRTASADGNVPAAARRVPHPPRGGPRRHGDRVRGRAGVAGPARGAEGPAVPGPGRRQPSGAVPPRGAGGGEAAPHQHRAGLRRRRAATGVHYYAMQFIHGQPLEQRASRAEVAGGGPAPSGRAGPVETPASPGRGRSPTRR